MPHELVIVIRWTSAVAIVCVCPCSLCSFFSGVAQWNLDLVFCFGTRVPPKRANLTFLEIGAYIWSFVDLICCPPCCFCCVWRETHYWPYSSPWYRNGIQSFLYSGWGIVSGIYSCRFWLHIGSVLLRYLFISFVSI